MAKAPPIPPPDAAARRRRKAQLVGDHVRAINKQTPATLMF